MYTRCLTEVWVSCESPDWLSWELAVPFTVSGSAADESCLRNSSVVCATTVKRVFLSDLKWAQQISIPNESSPDSSKISAFSC